MPRVNSVNALREPSIAGGTSPAKINPGVTSHTVRAGQAWASAIKDIGGAFAQLAGNAAAAQDSQNYALAQIDYNRQDRETWTDINNKADEQGNGFEQTPDRYSAIMKSNQAKYPIGDPKLRRKWQMTMLERSSRRGYDAVQAAQGRKKTYFKGVEDRQFAAAQVEVSKSPNMETINQQLQPLEDLVNSGRGIYHTEGDIQNRLRQYRGKLYSQALKTLAEKDPESATKLFDQIQKSGKFEIQGPSGPVRVFDADKVPTAAQRRDIWNKGGVVVNLDTNSSKKGGPTSPMVVIPDGATKEQRAAAESYAKQIAGLYAKQFGKTMKPRVVTRSQNGRGRSFTIHTEPYSVKDSNAVKFFSSPEGQKLHAEILRGTLGKIPGVQFSLPHGGTKGADKGAHGSGTNEVAIAKNLIAQLNDGRAPAQGQGDRTSALGQLAPGQRFSVDTKFGQFEVDSKSWNAMSGNDIRRLANFANERKGQVLRMRKADADVMMKNQIEHVLQFGSDAKDWDAGFIAKAYEDRPQKLKSFNARLEAARQAHGITDGAASSDATTLRDRLQQARPMEGSDNYAIRKDMYDQAERRVNRLLNARDKDPARAVDGTADRETWGRAQTVNQAYEQFTNGVPKNAKERFAVVDARLRAQNALGIAHPKPLTNSEASDLVGMLKTPPGGDHEAAARNLYKKIVEQYGEGHADKITDQVIERAFKDEEKRQLFKSTLDTLEQQSFRTSTESKRIEDEQKLLEGEMIGRHEAAEPGFFEWVLPYLPNVAGDQSRRLEAQSKKPIPPAAIKHLKDHPDTAQQFEEWFGLKPGDSKRYLEQAPKNE
jgi:hypothetical protein